MGELLLRDTGPIVPDGDDGGIPLPADRRIDALAGATVLGRVVQQIAEHLAHPLRVARNGGELLFTVGVGESNALPAEKLRICVHRVLQLRLDVHGFYGEGEAPVLDA